MYTCWCVLGMVYQHTAKRYMSEEVLLDIRNVRSPLRSAQIAILTLYSGSRSLSSTTQIGEKGRFL
jgi:hypothetical protein